MIIQPSQILKKTGHNLPLTSQGPTIGSKKTVVTEHSVQIVTGVEVIIEHW